MHTETGFRWLERSRTLRSIAAFALMGALGACGEAESTDSQPTETVSGALLNNVPYLPGVAGGHDVGAAVFNGKAYFTYMRDTDFHTGVLIESNLGSNGQSAQTYAINDNSFTPFGGATLVVYNNLLTMVYVNWDQKIYMRQSADGINWSASSQVGVDPVYTGTPTAIAAYGNLYIYALTVGGSYYHLVQVAVNGTTPLSTWWTGELTNNTPAAAFWNGNIYLAWSGTNSDKPIYVKHYDNASGTWSPPTIVPNNWGLPALFPLSSQTMEMVYRGNNGHIYRLYSNNGVSFGAAIGDGASWTDQTPVPFYRWGDSDAWTLYAGQNGRLYTTIE